MTSLSAWDKSLSDGAASLVQSRGRRIAAGSVAHSGDSQWWLIVGGLLWWLGVGDWREAGLRLIVITVAGGLITGILKRVIRRARPSGSAHLYYLQFDRHSFPSGHATRVGAMAVALGALAPWWGAMGLGLWALAVGGSRVALSLHFASDVVAGLLMGVLLGAVILLLR